MPSPFLARLRHLAGHPGAATLEDDAGSRSFAAVYEGARRAREALCAGSASLAGRRVAILLPPGAAWIEAFLGVLEGGGIAVPLCPIHPPAELAWFAADAGADLAVVAEELDDRASLLAKIPGLRILRPAELRAAEPRDAGGEGVQGGDTALLLYTSGTTGKPKGAMITHANLAIQGELLRGAWGCGPGDTLLHALPLHHLHGLGISLLTALLAGAGVRFLPRFDARRVWEALGGGGITVWMAVPTMYQKLLDAFDAEDDATRSRWTAGARALRLSTSGSAALPVTLAGRWSAIAGAIPLERFGMTEIGVGMSNPLEVGGRRAGSVGPPLPTVGARIVGDDGHDHETGPGELYIRGPSVFAGYWQRDQATRDAFAADPGGGERWFKTGDVAERSSDGYIRLLGRTSVDILKSGGYKLSALEIEEALRENPAVAEVAVVGLPDEVWGDRVVAVVVPAPGGAEACAAEPLRAWAKDRLAPYKIPREVRVVEALPRNAMGKVVKPELVKALTLGSISMHAPD